MPSKATAGVTARATVEEPSGHNNGGCAFCPADADGYDAAAEAALCKECSDAFESFRVNVLGVRDE
ncbi:hypothetical protein [Halorubrum salinum]|uniref:hypothetical protein n=1 Tax=Halorubrum salinum TaxID=767517 RepID=UPI0021130B35|nr:hypothetical protein [Halorubrum salinum]